MKIDGSCHCGHVCYEAEIDPDEVSICHYTDCQVLTGSAFRVTVPAMRATVRLLAEAPKSYIKTADNGKKRLQMFCPECGSPLFATGVGADGEVWGVRWGSIRQRAELVPRRTEWCRSASAWIGHIAQLPGTDTE